MLIEATDYPCGPFSQTSTAVQNDLVSQWAETKKWTNTWNTNEKTYECIHRAFALNPEYSWILVLPMPAHNVMTKACAMFASWKAKKEKIIRL